MKECDREEQVSWCGPRGLLHGVIHHPRQKADSAVIFIHGWSGCRLGPHRMFVKAARRFADLGWLCLRFDLSGRGLSQGDRNQTSIAGMTQDVMQAITFLRDHSAARQIILLGICSGGKVAISSAVLDKKVDGLILWSAEAMGPIRSAKATSNRRKAVLNEYLRKMLSIQTWKKLLNRRVNLAMVGRAMGQAEQPDETELATEKQTMDLFRSFPGKLLFLYGDNDPDTESTARAYAQFCHCNNIANDFRVIENANHSFYSLDSEKKVMDFTEEWLSNALQERQG